MKKRLITIRDETLRDGAQQPRINISLEDRINIALCSAELLDSSDSQFRNQIDLGMPETSFEMLKTIQKTVDLLKERIGLDFFVTGRATKDSIDLMIKSLRNLPFEKKIIAPFIGISKLHRKKLGLSKKDLLLKITDIIKYSKGLSERIHFPLEGGYLAYQKERDFVYEIFSILQDLKVEAVPFCDTVGTATPFSRNGLISYGDAIKDLKKRFPKIRLSVHCHNDLGLAVANTISGLINGADIIDGTYLGIGERAGNTSLETILTVLEVKKNIFGLRVKMNTKSLYKTSNDIAKILKLKIMDNTPVVGRNVFTHSSGIHQDGVLKDKRIYRPFIPTRIGIAGHEIKIGSLSGRRGVSYVLKNKYSIKLNENDLTLLVKKFKNKASLSNNPEKDLVDLAKTIIKK